MPAVMEEKIEAGSFSDDEHDDLEKGGLRRGGGGGGGGAAGPAGSGSSSLDLEVETDHLHEDLDPDSQEESPIKFSLSMADPPSMDADGGAGTRSTTPQPLSRRSTFGGNQLDNSQHSGSGSAIKKSSQGGGNNSNPNLVGMSRSSSKSSTGPRNMMRTISNSVTGGNGHNKGLVSILKKDNTGPAAALSRGNGMNKRQASFRGMGNKSMARSSNTMSTRFIMAAPTSKTVRFRLESDRESRRWFHQQMQPIDPRSLFMVRWQSLCIVFLSISFFRLPVIMAFGAHGLVVDFLCDIYFLIDNILAVNTAIIYKDRLITERREIAYRYFSWETFEKGERWSFYVFLMEFVPFYVGLVFTHIFDLPAWFLPLCAVFRARRMYDLLSYFHALEMRLDSDLRVLAVTKYALVLFGGAHWFGCAWWAVARFSGFEETCWVAQYLRLTGMPVSKETFKSTAYNYMLSLYWGFTVLTGSLIQGYAPDNTQETVLSIFSIFFQVFIFSFLLGILLHYIVKKDAHQEKFNSLMDKVERYAKMHDLPRKLESSIKLCFTFQHQKRIGQDEEILAAIPMTMRSKILAHRYQMVAANDMFSGCQEHFVTSILAVLRPKILIPGVTIYNRDDMTREALFLEEGEVEVYADDENVPYRIVRPTEKVFPVAGAIAFFLGIPQPFTHKASIKSHVKLLTLSKDDYEDIKDRYPESRDQLIDNIKAKVGLTRDAEGDVNNNNGGGMEGMGGVDASAGGGGGGGGGGRNGGGSTAEESANVAAAAVEAASGGPKKDSKEAELRRKVALGLQKKLDDDLATMFNAIDESDLEAVKLLLDKGFRPNAVDYDLRSGLHFAAAKGEDKIVELLVQRGADVHLRDRWDRNAIQDAIDNGHAAVTGLLATQGAELKLHNAAGRLCAAAFSDNLFELQRLVENGISCNTGDYDGRTALHLGACEGNNKVVEYLLLPMHKCNPGQLDRWGISPLFDAIKHGNLSVARILYENGARLSKGKAATFLCSAAADGDCALLQMLFECGVETNIGDYDSRFPIHLAAAEGEVVSVEFLMYAHADISVKDRWGRTPLDDAISEGHFQCAKVLMSFGAEFTIPLDEATTRQIEEVDLKHVRELVKKDRTEQDQRKSVAKQLRDTVKWMATETETWLKSLEERLKHLQRTTDRMISEDDCDELQTDTHAFLDQSDQSILVSERPERVSVPSNVGGEGSYMLSRFFSEAALTGGGGGGGAAAAAGSRPPSITPVGGVPIHGHTGGHHMGQHTRALKSMQHFFLKWNLIHASLRDWKDRVLGEACEEAPGWGGSIDKATLANALRGLDIHFSDFELDRAFAACHKTEQEKDKDRHRRGGSGGVGSLVDRTSGTLLEEGGDDKTLVCFEDLMTAMPVWSLIMRAPAMEDSDLALLQETVDVICEGFRLLTRHGNSKLGRAAWMIQKRESDMGEFASVIDNVFLERDSLDKETFFLVVARWAALREDDGLYDVAGGEGVGAGGGGAGAPQSGQGEFMSGGGGDISVNSEVRSFQGYDPYHPKASRVPGLRMSDPFVETNVAGKQSGLGASYYGHRPVLPKSFMERMITSWKLWQVKRRLRASLKQKGGSLPSSSSSSSALHLSMPDFERHFARLDADQSGWLDHGRTELLLMWGYDADLAREDWELVARSLQDPLIGKVNLASIERFWLELHGIVVKCPSGASLDASMRNGKSMDSRGGNSQIRELAARAAKELAALNASGSKRMVGGMIVVEKTPLSERVLFDSKGTFIWLWGGIMTLNALYYFLSVPFMIAFLHDVILTEYAGCLWVAYAFDCLLVCDSLVKLNTSFLDTSCSVLVVDRRRIRQRYLTGDFILDAVGTLPLDILVRYLGGSGLLVTCLRLPKLLFCHRLLAFFQRRSLSSSSRLAADLQALLFSALGMIHLLTCVWFIMTDNTANNYQFLSGYEDYGDYTNHPEGGGPFRLEYYIFCFMLIATMISTQGIYDLVMGRVNEMLFTMVVLLLNLSAWAYLMGTISGLCVTSDESIAQSHELMTAVSRFIQHNPMPPGVSEELKCYFNVNAQQKNQLSLAEQAEIYRDLPLSLQVEAARHISRDSLLGVDIFEKTSDYFLDSISTLLDMEIFGVGDFVYKADDICRSLYIVAAGSVEIGKTNSETNEFEVEDVATPGSALGQLEFLFDVRYMYSARVSGADDVRVFRLGKEDFTRVIKLYPMDEDILYENLSRLADDKIDANGRAPSIAPSMSTQSLDSSVFSALAGDDLMEKAMDSIDKAKKRSKEQRIRSFCNAAAEGNMDILQRLLRSGIDVNGRDCNGRTALMVASCAGNFELVKWLVSLGADVNMQDKFGDSALLDAMNQDTDVHREITGFLSQNGAVLELEDGAGVLCQLAADGDHDKLSRMLELNITPDVADYDARTPLHLAASEGHLDCVKLLLQYWANVNPIDRMGGTPLTDAVRHGHVAIQKVLREHGGILNMDPVELGTAACEAGSSGDLESIRVLVDNGADINEGDYDGRSALHLATCFNRLSVIEYLVSIPSINVNPLDRLGNTPLDDAIREGFPAIANILEVHGGVSGTDASLAEKVAAQGAKKVAAAQAKQFRREEALRLYGEWSAAQDRLSEVYKYMSEYLPPMCKYINLLSMTLRSRRTQSTIDRSPKPDLAETRLYFYNSFLAFLERRYKVNLESSMTLIEELAESSNFEDKARISGQILDRYLDPKSNDRVHFHPAQVAVCKERYQMSFRNQAFPDDLFESFRLSVAEKMEALLPEYFESDFFYRACRQSNGFLWRVMKLSRLIYELCNQALTSIIEPFLELCERDALACVPHYSTKSRQDFRDEFVKLKNYITALQPILHIIAYKSKQDAMRDAIKEKRDKHSGPPGFNHMAIGGGGGGGGTGSSNSSSGGGLRQRR